MTPSIFVNEVVLEHSHAHLCITSGCPCTTMADPSSCGREQNPYSLDFFSKRLLTPFSVPSAWAQGPGIFRCVCTAEVKNLLAALCLLVAERCFFPFPKHG